MFLKKGTDNFECDDRLKNARTCQEAWACLATKHIECPDFGRALCGEERSCPSCRMAQTKPVRIAKAVLHE